MKRFGLIKRKDFYVLAVLLFVCIIIFVWMFFVKTEGNCVVIQQNGEVIMKLSLEDAGTYVIKDGEFVNELVIEDGVAYMKDANCRDLICVHHSSISKVNETITCLPHKLIVYVTGNEISDVDAVVK
jgi:hypothetical protein